MSISRLPLFLLVFILGISCFSCKQNGANYEFSKEIRVDNAAVVSAHPKASEIGLNILKQGGNAIDAAIGVQFALAVCYPVAGNIGGGGFMVFKDTHGNIECLDFRETAPAGASADMYLDSQGNAISEKSQKGHLAAGVPGSVKGMVDMFEKYSKLKDWKALLQPSIDIAQNGFYITERQAKYFNEEKDNFIQYNDHQPALVKEHIWKKNDLLIQKDLAKVLTAIRDHKADGFYSSWVADTIVRSMNANGGIITHQDLKDYKTIWRKPISTNYKGYSIHSMPPPSSGGIALTQLLEMVEPYSLEKMPFHSAKAIHLITEAERRVYADRATHLGDSDFYEVPVDSLLNPYYLKDRMLDFDIQHASQSDSIYAGQFSESEQTTHFSIIDTGGNAVSITTTINGAYGSKSFVRGAGFLLNNEMDDFSIKPGEPNLYGLIGAEANKIEPGKRMLSSMTPTIVEKEGQTKMILGTPGGSTIITSVFQTIINKIDFDLSLRDAVHLPRFHHQWKPDEIRLEPDSFSNLLQDTLKAMGHKIKIKGKIGRVEAIWINEDGTIEAVADHRGDDTAVGY